MGGVDAGAAAVLVEAPAVVGAGEHHRTRVQLGQLALRGHRVWGVGRVGVVHPVDDRGFRHRAVTADGLTNPILANSAPYDMIIANILAGPLTQLAPAIQRSLAPGAALVLSGLLHNQEGLVKSFYQSLRFVGARRDGPWSALVLEKPAR